MKSSSFSLCSSFILSMCMVLLLLPSVGHAATKTPSCMLFVSTPEGLVTIRDTKSIVVEKGDAVALSWLGIGAARAEQNKKPIPLTGVSSMTAEKTVSQSFLFHTGNETATCTVTFLVIDITVDQKTLVSKQATPTITGDATGIDSLSLEVWDESDTKKLYTHNSIPVKKGHWKAKISKKLEDGLYTIRIFTGDKNDRQLLTTANLRVGDVPPSKTTVAAEPVSLLTGGLLKANSSVPVAYLHLVNLGKDTAHVKGFTVTQHGSAVTSVIQGLTLHDRGALVGSSSGTLFNKKKEASIDADISLAPGESRVFTIKAQAAHDMYPFLGTDVKLDVTAIETDAVLQTQFPLRGTTWKPSLY